MPAPLAFHVLGPLQVTQADAPVVLGGPRERVLLAALLVEHGRVVSVDGLSQALGGDREEAAGLLRAGLALWRGPALCGIDRPFAEIEAARLEERRLLVTEEHIALE